MEQMAENNQTLAIINKIELIKQNTNKKKNTKNK